MKNKQPGEWMFDHPIKSILIIGAIDLAFFFFLVWLIGCSAERRPRFANGDATVMSPPSYEENQK